jgi:RHS repeat-associated protein
MNTVQTTDLCRYRYDALDRLVNTTVATQATTQRFYNKSRLTTEIQGQIKRSFFQLDDLLLAQRQLQGQSSDTTLLGTDSQRSVLHAVASGQHNPMVYSPYGHRPAENGHLSLLGFNGEQPDPVTGHYLLGNGYRAFNPVLMRFNSPDSLSPFDEGGLNAYAYAVGNPVNRVDPTGHFVIAATFLGVLTAAGGTSLSIASSVTGNDDLLYAGVGLLALSVLSLGIGSVGGYITSTRVKNIQSLSDNHRRVALGEQRLWSKGGGNRLIIQAHGREGRVPPYTPDRLASAVMDKYPDFDARFTDVKLISCHGANGGRYSTGQQLADVFQKPVKAYKGLTTTEGSLRDMIREPSVSKSATFTKDRYPYRTTKTYEGVSYPYTPVVFKPFAY